MLADAQGLTLSFYHQQELSLAQSNASEAHSILRSAQNSSTMALSQQTTVNATVVNVTDLLATEASQRRNVTTLRNEVALQQTRLELLQQNITAVQVSSVSLMMKFVSKPLEVVVSEMNFIGLITENRNEAQISITF